MFDVDCGRHSISLVTEDAVYLLKHIVFTTLVIWTSLNPTVQF